MKKTSVIIPAGGSSSRFGKTNKLLEKINNKEIILHSVDKFLNMEEVHEIVISASLELKPTLIKLIKNQDKIKIVNGGKTRQESVFNALKSCNSPDLVLIHDAARPLTKIETIKKALKIALEDKKNVVVGVKTIDTIKVADKNNKILSTPDRSALWNVQTPQIFDYKTILNAHEKLKGKDFSDDSLLLETLGNEVFMIEGDYSNIKITTAEDLILAKGLI